MAHRVLCVARGDARWKTLYAADPEDGTGPRLALCRYSSPTSILNGGQVHICGDILLCERYGIGIKATRDIAMQLIGALLMR